MNTSRKAFTIIPAVLLTVLMVTSIPSAFANSPSFGGIPTLSGSDTTITVGPTASTLSRGQEIEVVDQDVNSPPAILLAGGSCPIVLGDYSNLVVTSDVWELRHPISGTIGYDVGSAAGSFIEIKFGPSGASGTVTAFGSAKVYRVTAGPIFTQIAEGPTAPVVAGTDTFVGTWTNVQGANAPNTSRVGNWFMGTCGQDAPGSSGPNYKIPGGFLVTLPVGGTILPIDGTALLVAGISTSALWLVPLVAVAGVAFAILGFQVNKKQK